MPSKVEAIRDMLELGKVNGKDVVIDIGSGDGRVLFAAVEKCKEAYGFEIDPVLVARSRKSCTQRKVQDKVHIIEGDWLNEDQQHVYDKATVVVLFFLPHASIAELLEKRLKSGTKVISYAFEIPEWTCVQLVDSVPFMTWKGSSPIMLYRVP